MSEKPSPELEKFFHEVFIALGGDGIEVELSDIEYNLALDEAMRFYYSLSGNSIERGFVFLNIIPGQQEYYLPPDIDEVVDIRRSRSGLTFGLNFEPFTAAYIQSAFAQIGSQAGMHTATNLVGYEAIAQYQEQVGRMFGEFIPHTFNASLNRLTIFSMPRGEETYAIDCSRKKSRDELFKDPVVYRWLRNYTKAECMMILSEKYTKTGNFVGAQGGVTLKDMSPRAEQLKQVLEKEILDFVDGGYPVFPFMG